MLERLEKIIDEKTGFPVRERDIPIEYCGGLIEDICNEIAQGNTLSRVAREHADWCPSAHILRKWLLSTDKKYDMFRSLYDTAITCFIDAKVDRIEELEDECMVKIEEDYDGKAKAIQAHYKQMIEDIRWLVSKIGYKKYGDRLSLAGDDKEPLTVSFNVPRPGMPAPGKKPKLKTKNIGLLTTVVTQDKTTNAI